MADSRDWDKEMAEIDRLMAKEAKAGPPAPGPAPNAPTAPARVGTGAGGAPAATPVAARPERGAVAPVARGVVLRIWLMALMGALGAGALAIWPYAKGCGTMLAVYLVGVAAVAGAGVWTMRAAWVARRGFLHLLGLAALLAALGLAALEILPRVGYAATALTWACST